MSSTVIPRQMIFFFFKKREKIKKKSSLENNVAFSWCHNKIAIHVDIITTYFILENT